MLMARFQKDNNIEMILDGYVSSQRKDPFIVIGGHQNKYGEYLLTKYKAYSGIRFLGVIYKDDVTNPLRCYSKLYFHGHSVGGTNPSLLEAMAANAFIAAHDNPFNRFVLEGNAYYFSSSEEVAILIKNFSEKEKQIFLKNNFEKIKKVYQWDKVGAAYLRVFENALEIRKNNGERIC